MDKIPLIRNTAYKLYQNKCSRLLYKKGSDYYPVIEFRDLNNPLYLQLTKYEKNKILKLEIIMSMIDFFSILFILIGTSVISYFLFNKDNSIIHLGFEKWFYKLNYNYKIYLMITLIIYHHCWHHLLNLSLYCEPIEKKIQLFKESIINKYL